MSYYLNCLFSGQAQEGHENIKKEDGEGCCVKKKAPEEEGGGAREDVVKEEEKPKKSWY